MKNLIYLSDSNKTFLDFLKDFQQAEIVQKLVIDTNVDLTSIPPQIIEVDIPIVIMEGCKFITPEVALPITDTVNNSYVQINFNEEFTASKNYQIFEGDGLIWFNENSIEIAYATWWGIKTYPFLNPPKGTAYDKFVEDGKKNTKALQQAVNCIVLDRKKATSRLKLPNRLIPIASPVVAFAVDLNSHPFLTGKRANKAVMSTIIDIEGAESISHESNYGNTTNIHYLANWGAPFITQGLRNSKIHKIRFEGQNDYKSKDNSGALPPNFIGSETIKNFVRTDDFQSYDKSKIGWISDNIVWSKSQGYAPIIMDAFSTSVNNGGYSLANCTESTIDLYYGNTAINHQCGWMVQIHDLHVQKFVSAVVATLVGNQGDNIDYNNILFQWQPFGLSICQDQSRSVTVSNIVGYSGTYSVFEGCLHGRGVGVLPTFSGETNTPGSSKYIAYGFDVNRGNFNLKNVYAENLYAVGRDKGNRGESLTGGKNSSFVSSISECSLKFANEMTYESNGVTHFLPRRPSIEYFSILNSHIGLYGEKNNNLYANHYADCEIINSKLGGGRTAIDAKWYLGGTSSTSNMYLSRGVAPNDKPNSGAYTDSENIGRRSGILKQNNSNGNLDFQILMYNLKSYGLEEVKDYRVLDFESVEIDVARCCITVKGENVNKFKQYELVYLNGVPYTDIGTVYSISENTMIIANLSQYKLSKFNPSATRINKVYITKSHFPFIGTAIDGKIKIEGYQPIGNTNSIVEVEEGSKIRMPNGLIYFIEKKDNDVLTLDRSYTDVLNSEWVFPLYSNIETFGYDSVKHNVNGFYEKGRMYELYENDRKTGETIICTKTGNSHEMQYIKQIKIIL